MFTQLLGTACATSESSKNQAGNGLDSGEENAAGLRFLQAGKGAIARTVEEKLRERVSIADFGAKTGQNAVTAISAALATLGFKEPATLIFPRGRWLISSDQDWSQHENVAFAFDHGAIVEHGPYRLVLPTAVAFGSTTSKCFRGTGEVVSRNPAAVTLTPPPGGWTQHANLSIGINALAANGGGTNNIAFGHNALKSNVGGSSNIAIGNDALKSVRGRKIPAVGTFTGEGWNNIAIGDTALRDCDAGYENLAIGALTLQRNVSGTWNVAIGHNSQILATANNCNISLGAYTLPANFGNNNIAIGWAALEAQSVGSNIAIGHTTMNANVSGSLNTAVGSAALFSNKSGNQNVAVGLETLHNLNAGDNNTAVGTYALASALGKSTNNTAIGRGALLVLANGDGNTAVGSGALNTLRNFHNCTGLGLSASVSGNNQVQLGNSETTTYAYGAVQSRSDRRDKADIRDTILGLSFITRLRPVDFRWDMRDDYRASPPDHAAESGIGTRRPSGDAIDIRAPRVRDGSAGRTLGAELRNVSRDGSKKRTRYHHGLVAQEVRDVIAQTGLDFGGLQDHTLNGGDDVLSLGYEELIAPMIKAIQELNIEVEALKTEISALKSQARP